VYSILPHNQYLGIFARVTVRIRVRLSLVKPCILVNGFV